MISIMDEIKQIRGKWWIVSNPDNKINGTLIIDPSSREKLTIDGSFPEISPFRKEGDKMVLSSEIEKIDLILGFGFDGKTYSLVNCDLIGGQLFATQVFNVDIIFEGIHFQTKEDIRLKEMSVRYNYLETWMNLRTLSVNQNEQVFSIHGTKSESYDIILDNTTSVSFRVTTLPSVSLTQAVMEQRIFFNVISKEYLEIDQYFTIIFYFQEFLSLIMLHPAFVTEINAGKFIQSASSGQEKFHDFISVKIFLSHSRITEKINPKDLFFTDALFTFPEIKSDIEYIIANWFNLYKKQKSMLDAYFASVFIQRLYVESNFLAKVQCLEVFHRHSENYSKYVYDISEHQKRIEILETLVKENESLQLKQLKPYISKMKRYGNEPNLEQRLNEILSSYPDIFSIFISNFKKFSKDIADNRNYLTHLEKKSDHVYATDVDLYYYTLKLEAILYVCILAELGFKKEQIQQFMKKFVKKKSLIIDTNPVPSTAVNF
jgi:hypothetical protein